MKKPHKKPNRPKLIKKLKRHPKKDRFWWSFGCGFLMAGMILMVWWL